LQWLVRQLGKRSDRQDSENLNRPASPSSELIDHLDRAVDSRDGRTYRRLMDNVLSSLKLHGKGLPKFINPGALSTSKISDFLSDAPVFFLSVYSKMV
jgi:hypothetical protein